MVGDGDMDDDLILDEVDNCPTVANANQFNEDGDAFGNLCDNCPAEDNPQQLDTDLDELGDLCDPQPGQANQMLHFEGFDELPDASDWTGLGSWQIDSGSLVQSDNTERYSLQYGAVDGSDKILVVSKIQFSNPLGPNGRIFRYGGVYLEAGAGPDSNGCWLLRNLSLGEGYTGVRENNGTLSYTSTVGPDLVDESDYVVKSSVDGSTHSCGFEHGTPPVEFDYTGSNLNGQGIGIITSYTQAKVAYFYAVRLE